MKNILIFTILSLTAFINCRQSVEEKYNNEMDSVAVEVRIDSAEVEKVADESINDPITTSADQRKPGYDTPKPYQCTGL